jgi:hypothetical protein
MCAVNTVDDNKVPKCLSRSTMGCVMIDDLHGFSLGLEHFRDLAAMDGLLSTTAACAAEAYVKQ